MGTEEMDAYNRHPILIGSLISIISSIIAAGILYLVAMAFDIKPEIKSIKEKQNDIELTCQELLDKLPPLPPAGLIPCKVGINEKVHKDYVWMYENSSIELESGNTILLTNMGSTIKPSVQLTIKVIGGTPNNDTSGDFFVSSETLKRLDIDEEDIWDGIFSMKYKVLKIGD